MRGSLPVFGRTKPISCKIIVFVALRGIHHISDQVSGIFGKQPSRAIAGAV
jgi:hypothetical protein